MKSEFIQAHGYKIHRIWNDMIFGGSALIGTTEANYNELEKLFGEPQHVGGKLIDKRWLIEADDGTVFTVFNYQGAVDKYCIGGFGKSNKNKENLSLLKAMEIIGK